MNDFRVFWSLLNHDFVGNGIVNLGFVYSLNFWVKHKEFRSMEEVV